MIRLTWTDTNTIEDGYNVYRSSAPMNTLTATQLANYLIAELGPDVEQYDDETITSGENYYYIVAARKDGVISPALQIAVQANVGEDDFTGVQIGDEIGGGIYAGIDTINGADYHIIAGKYDSEEYGLRWKTSRTSTPGTGSATDGLANTLAMEAAGLSDHPAAAHCLADTGGGRSGWHMPARSQLTLMYHNLAGHAEFNANVSSGDYTWASTEDSSTSAWGRRFSDGLVGTSSFKDNTLRRVRPVRRVAV